LNWLEKDDIRQNEDEYRIEVRISDKLNYALVTIDKNRDKAALRFKRRPKRMSKKYPLKNTNVFILKSLTMSLKQHCVHTFLIFCDDLVIEKSIEVEI
jgi:hypothetical protein